MRVQAKDRRARLHATLDRVLDSALGQVEQAVKRAAPSAVGAVTTEPGSIGGKAGDSNARLQRAYDAARRGEARG